MTAPSIGAHLLNLRRAQRISRRRLARRMCAVFGDQSFTEESIVRIECRGRRPSYCYLYAAAEALGVELDGLLRIEGETAWTKQSWRHWWSTVRRDPQLRVHDLVDEEATSRARMLCERARLVLEARAER